MAKVRYRWGSHEPDIHFENVAASEQDEYEDPANPVICGCELERILGARAGLSLSGRLA